MGSKSLGMIASVLALLAAVYAAGEGGSSTALLVPLVIATAPLLLARWRWLWLAYAVSGLLMLAFCLVTAFSVGVMFAPSALTLLVASGVARKEIKGDDLRRVSPG